MPNDDGRVRAPLRIAVAQPPVVAYDVTANAEAHAAAVQTANARVVVFPELSLTGYELDAPAIRADDPRLAPIAEACGHTGSLALAGAPVRGEDGRSHIGILAIGAAGARVAYRKMWLGTAEAEWFAPGTEPAVVEVEGWRLGLAVCKDTGVPRHAADTAALGIDVYVAGLLEPTEAAAILEERALRVAANHHVWVAIASFAGSTGGGYDHAAGCSAIWNPDGALVTRAGPDPGEIACATLA